MPHKCDHGVNQQGSEPLWDWTYVAARPTFRSQDQRNKMQQRNFKPKLEVIALKEPRK